MGPSEGSLGYPHPNATNDGFSLTDLLTWLTNAIPGKQLTTLPSDPKESGGPFIACPQ